MKLVLLAAGLSKRMNGKNKLLLPMKESTVFEEAIKSALKYTDDILVVTGYERENLLEIIYKYKVEEVFNPLYETGQESSIDAALSKVDEDILIAPSDLPLLSREHYLRAEMGISAHPCARPCYEGVPGHPVAITKELVRKAKTRSIPLRMLLKENGLYLYKEDKASVSDIDTPEAYDRLFTALS
ncbi:MAG: nucleotidyltransferase family protein [Sphaerochaetaceae bacterium]|nr:nucleotidyltransferase family protein [Sphaerochaetaceae bacterium]